MAECSSEEYARSLTNPSSITCLSRGEAIGLTVTVQAGLLSLLALLYVLGMIARNTWTRNQNLRIFRKPIDILMVSLLLGDFVQAIGAVLSLRWIQNGKVEIGSFCNAQGIIRIFGMTAVALSTLAIAVYTFLAIWVGADVLSMRFTFSLVATIWSFIALLVAVGVTVNRNQEISFIGPTPYWCAVNNHNVGWKMATEYLWMWVTLALSILIYIPLYLWMRGILIVDETSRWSFYLSCSTDLNPVSPATRRTAVVMLAYPAVYSLITLPLSAVRWTTFVQQGSAISPAVTFAVVSIFGLSGILDVILLSKTRPSSGLFGYFSTILKGQPEV